MIEKSTFTKAIVGIAALIVAGLGLNAFHIGVHHTEKPTPVVAPEVAHDTHVHSVYWIANQEKPGTLIEVNNKVYGEPKEGVVHRHTGADYMQNGAATWKHVHDQHVKKN